MIKTMLVTLLALVGFQAAQAQKGKTKLGLQYTVAIPSGDFKDVIGKESVRGWGVDIMHGVSDRLQLGVGAGFQDYYQKNDRQVYHYDDGQDISAVLTHSIQTIPILAKVKYSLTEGTGLQPYVGIGAGGNLVMFRELLGEFGNTENYFKLAVRPELGIHIPFRNLGGINVGAAYNYMPFNEYGIKNLNNISVSAGVSIPLRSR